MFCPWPKKQFQSCFSPPLTYLSQESTLLYQQEAAPTTPLHLILLQPQSSSTRTSSPLQQILHLKIIPVNAETKWPGSYWPAVTLLGVGLGATTVGGFKFSPHSHISLLSSHFEKAQIACNLHEPTRFQISTTHRPIWVTADQNSTLCWGRPKPPIKCRDSRKCPVTLSSSSSSSACCHSSSFPKSATISHWAPNRS